VIAILQKSLTSDAPEWFEVIAAGDVVPAKKPAPDIYQYVLKKMSLSADNCIAIEDSLHGLQAAVALGIKTVITVNDYTQNEDFSEAILVLNHLGERELPFQAISGDVVTAHCLNLDLLRRLHSN
jgi:beta-phosphoglucomutase-like phosphatase (HAD superfamily)